MLTSHHDSVTQVLIPFKTGTHETWNQFSSHWGLKENKSVEKEEL